MCKELYVHKCYDCKLKFRDDKPRTVFCPSCKARHKYENILKNRERCKKPKFEVKAAPGLPKLTINEVCRLLKAYNKKNDTNLSYGQFVKKIYQGDLDMDF